MILITINDPIFQHDSYHIVKAFYPNEDIKIQIVDKEENYAIMEQNGEEIFRISKNQDFEDRRRAWQLELEQWDAKEKKLYKNQFNSQLYQALSKHLGKTLKWGILTGMRPTKIAMKKWKELRDREEAKNWLQSYYCMSERKAALALDIAEREDRVIESIPGKDSYSLYIGIPFCPTRCTYCSFTSYPLKEWENRMNDYLEALLKELAYVACKSKEKVLDTIYVGGGTPTSLNEVQLDRLLTELESLFNLQTVREITVEAGRPDSITEEKLKVLRRHGIGRISINPQTMQAKTLVEIGRSHSVQDIIEVYELARALGFDNINMDLIMGLPGENLEDVESTLHAIEKLKPNSLTIHSLAIKRASTLNAQGKLVEEEHQMEEMIDLAANYAKKMELVPYYLYRQKNMAGNFENVGYAEVDKAGIYNILIMEEKQSIIAVGAGASTKIILPREKDNIIRIENVKDVNQYIDRIDEMIERKGEWLWP